MSFYFVVILSKFGNDLNKLAIAETGKKIRLFENLFMMDVEIKNVGQLNQFDG